MQKDNYFIDKDCFQHTNSHWKINLRRTNPFDFFHFQLIWKPRRRRTEKSSGIFCRLQPKNGIFLNLQILAHPKMYP